MTTIYVLKCDQDKYYIGKTNRSVEERFQEHLNNPCAWTRKYPPTHVIHSFESRFDFDEDMTTLEYMKRYGINNVRGGTYTQVFLPKHQYFTIKNQITHVDNKCFKCYQDDHFAKDCPENNESQQSLGEACGNLITSCWKLYNCFKGRKNSQEYIELDQTI